MSQKDTIGILIIDDDRNFVEKYVIPAFSKENDWTKKALPNLDFNVKFVNSQKAARDELKQHGQKYHIALVDLRLKKEEMYPADSDEEGGLKVLKYIKQQLPIMFTGAHDPSSVKTAFEAITQNGAFGYIFKSDNNAFQRQLLLEVSRARKYIELERRVISAGGLVGESPAMNKVLDFIARVADSNATVLITGERGTGKELVARAIHENSRRKSKPFIPINCAAMPEGLVEDELFGHIKGAFADAFKERPGRFELAHKGTIFLDEIGDMSLATQAKVLRVLQERKFERLGGTKTIEVDVRVIAATNKDLQEAIKIGDFRDDLYDRLNILLIQIPPLRERKEDIPLLVDHFIQKYSDKEDKFIIGISNDGIELLMKYDWPGNVRQLESTIWRAVLFSKGQILDVNILYQAMYSVEQESQMVNDLPAEIRNKITEEFCQKFNEWCRQNDKPPRRIKTEDILGILAIVYNEGKVTPKKCEEKLGLEHTKASNVLAFLAHEKFLKRNTQRSPYFGGEQFDAYA